MVDATAALGLIAHPDQRSILKRKTAGVGSASPDAFTAFDANTCQPGFNLLQRTVDPHARNVREPSRHRKWEPVSLDLR